LKQNILNGKRDSIYVEQIYCTPVFFNFAAIVSTKQFIPQLKLIKGIVSFIDHWNNCFALSGALTAMSKSLIFGVLLPL
jgi:hypothetical protein